MSIIENQFAAIGCTVTKNLIETAQIVVHCESEGYVLVDVLGVCSNPEVLDEQFFLYILTNYTDIYRCIIMLGSDLDIYGLVVDGGDVIINDYTEDCIINKLQPLIMDAILHSDDSKDEVVIEFRVELDEVLEALNEEGPPWDECDDFEYRYKNKLS